MRGVSMTLCLAAALSTAGCATVTGLVSGAFTGSVDCTAEIYRHNSEAFEDQPTYWAPTVLVFVPVGIVLGPVVGFAKGIALDMEKLIGETNYGPVFGGYDKVSIWRPYTFGWHEADVTAKKSH